MSITFEVAKANEATLQKLFEDTEFNVTVHPKCMYLLHGRHSGILRWKNPFCKER